MRLKNSFYRLNTQERIMKKVLLSLFAFCGFVHASNDFLPNDSLSTKLNELIEIDEHDSLLFTKRDLIKLISEIKKVEVLGQIEKTSLSSFNEILEIIRSSGILLQSIEFRESSLGTQGR